MKKKNLKGEITIVISPPKSAVDEENVVFNDDIKKIIALTKKKIGTKDLSELLSIIYKKPKKFFYTKLIKSIR